jgi:hypothetical protein
MVEDFYLYNKPKNHSKTQQIATNLKYFNVQILTLDFDGGNIEILMKITSVRPIVQRTFYNIILNNYYRQTSSMNHALLCEILWDLFFVYMPPLNVYELNLHHDWSIYVYIVSPWAFSKLGFFKAKPHTCPYWGEAHGLRLFTLHITHCEFKILISCL